MNYSSKIVDIVARIYESVAYNDAWQDVLCDINDLLDAHSSNLIITDNQTSQLTYISHEQNEALAERYIENYAELDERRIAIEESLVGSIKKGSELVFDKAFSQSSIYVDFFKDIDCFHSVGCCFYRDAQFTAVINLYRSESKPDFDNNAKKLLGILAPHLTRAFTISVQINLAQLQSQIHGQLKYTTTTALFLIMDQGSAKPMNDKAQELVDDSSVLNLMNNRLSFKNQAANKRLQHLVKQCLLTSQGKEAFPGGFIRLESSDEQTNEWHIGVTPYRSSAQDQNLWKAKGALVIVRPIKKEVFHKLNAVLSDFYDLTASETQVLTKIISGLSGSQIAEELNLTKECVRSRLKKIYQKTGVSNQVQLTHNILEGPYKLVNMLR